MRTLTIDIGGTGIKMLPLDAAGAPLSERAREKTPRPATPAAILDVIDAMLSEQASFDRVSAGFPGVVKRGVVHNAPNLENEAFVGFPLQAELESRTGRPVRVINDADLLGYGAMSGEGVELVLTLGTGLGSALFCDGRLVPNLELGHQPFRKGKTYEDRVCDAERKRIGKKRFRRRVLEVIAQLEPLVNYDRLHLGGGNTKHLVLDELPSNVSVFSSVEGMRGGIRLWEAAG